MRKLGKRDVLRKAIAHFSKPGAVLAYDVVYGCVYRGGKDPSSPVRCALGAVIPDDMYCETWEGTGASGLMADRVGLSDLFTAGVTPEFLNSVQACHDQVAQTPSGYESGNPAEVVVRLRLLAEREGITL